MSYSVLGTAAADLGDSIQGDTTLHFVSRLTVGPSNDPSKVLILDSSGAAIHGSASVEGALTAGSVDADAVTTAALVASNATATDLGAADAIVSGTLQAGETDVFGPLRAWSNADVTGAVTADAVGVGAAPEYALDVRGDGAVRVPTGSTASRPAAVQGLVRFNTDRSAFEGAVGAEWRALGGPVDVDGDTYVQAETAPGADDDALRLVAAGLEALTVTAAGASVAGALAVTGDATVQGGASVLGDVAVTGSLAADGGVATDYVAASNTLTLEAPNIVLDGNVQVAGTLDTVNSSTVTVQDRVVTLASAAPAVQTDGPVTNDLSGVTVEGLPAGFADTSNNALYYEKSVRWEYGTAGVTGLGSAGAAAAARWRVRGGGLWLSRYAGTDYGADLDDLAPPDIGTASYAFSIDSNERLEIAKTDSAGGQTGVVLAAPARVVGDLVVTGSISAELGVTGEDVLAFDAPAMAYSGSNADTQSVSVDLAAVSRTDNGTGALFPAITNLHLRVHDHQVDVAQDPASAISVTSLKGLSVAGTTGLVGSEYRVYNIPAETPVVVSAYYGNTRGNGAAATVSLQTVAAGVPSAVLALAAAAGGATVTVSWSAPQYSDEAAQENVIAIEDYLVDTVLLHQADLSARTASFQDVTASTSVARSRAGALGPLCVYSATVAARNAVSPTYGPSSTVYFFTGLNESEFTGYNAPALSVTGSWAASGRRRADTAAACGAERLVGSSAVSLGAYQKVPLHQAAAPPSPSGATGSLTLTLAGPAPGSAAITFQGVDTAADSATDGVVTVSTGAPYWSDSGVLEGFYRRANATMDLVAAAGYDTWTASVQVSAPGVTGWSYAGGDAPPAFDATADAGADIAEADSITFVHEPAAGLSAAVTLLSAGIEGVSSTTVVAGVPSSAQCDVSVWFRAGNVGQFWTHSTLATVTIKFGGSSLGTTTVSASGSTFYDQGSYDGSWGTRAGLAPLNRTVDLAGGVAGSSTFLGASDTVSLAANQVLYGASLTAQAVCYNPRGVASSAASVAVQGAHYDRDSIANGVYAGTAAATRLLGGDAAATRANWFDTAWPTTASFAEYAPADWAGVSDAGAAATEAVLYDGAFRGAASAGWQIDWAPVGGPDYSAVAAATRWLVLRFDDVYPVADLGGYGSILTITLASADTASFDSGTRDHAKRVFIKYVRSDLTETPWFDCNVTKVGDTHPYQMAGDGSGIRKEVGSYLNTADTLYVSSASETYAQQVYIAIGLVDSVDCFVGNVTIS